MPIVSSELEVDAHTQIDGSVWVREIHTDHLGNVYPRLLKALQGVDASARMLARVPDIEASLAWKEIAANVKAVLQEGSAAVLSFDHSVVGDNRASLRDAYRHADRQEAIMIGDFLNSLTDPQLQTLFGMTQGQVDTLRTNRLQPAADAATAIRTAAGE